MTVIKRIVGADIASDPEPDSESNDDVIFAFKIAYCGPSEELHDGTFRALARLLGAEVEDPDPEEEKRYVHHNVLETSMPLAHGRMEFLLMSVPPDHPGARLLLLKRVDAVIFVLSGDSLEPAIAAARDLVAALRAHGVDPDSVPIIIQRHGGGPDDRVLIERLQLGSGPVIVADEKTGEGIMASLKAAARALLLALRNQPSSS